MTSHTRPPLVLLSGPTGTGKSRIAVALARRLAGEIVNADSVQIYRGFDIGSAKPDRSLRDAVPHHLYDQLDPDEHLDVAGWVSMADGVIASIRGRGNVPIVVGGTNFYLRALLRGLPELPPRQPEMRRRLDPILRKPTGPRHLHRLLRSLDPESGRRIAQSDRHRIERAIEVYAASGRPISSFSAPSPDHPSRHHHIQIAMRLERSELRSRLDARVETMYEAGLIDEVRGLLENHPADLRPFTSIGYREAVDYIEGRIDQDTAVERTKQRTRAYARRQMTWLRAERGVQWLDAAQAVDSIVNSIVGVFENVCEAK